MKGNFIIKIFIMKTKFIIYCFIIFLLIGFFVFIGVLNDKQISVVNNCRVIELQQQQLIRGDKESLRTEIRYLIITDKETFICESSIINGKYDNSNLFWHLKKDATYNFKVCGFGKSFLFDYRNVLEVIN